MIEKKDKRIQLCVTLPKDIIDWLDEEIKKVRFANKSHGIEFALQKLKREDEENKGKNRVEDASHS